MLFVKCDKGALNPCNGRLRLRLPEYLTKSMNFRATPKKGYRVYKQKKYWVYSLSDHLSGV